ncbi:MAG: homogentisate phytyltransferase [Xenococcaceae cyanobacterium]
MNMLYSLWKFSRPHTIVGTSLSVLALYVIALTSTSSNLTTIHIWQLLGTLFACLCGNIYIVGLNQLEDVEIDRINKPHLPIAAGEFSRTTGTWIVAVTGIIALGLAGYLGHWLLATVVVSLLIGTAYSLPPIRLKRFPLLAALCIFTVRGVVVNLGLFAHFNQIVNESIFFPVSVWTITLFIVVFTVAIAIFKDVPDLEGDRKYNIKTFTLLLGKPAIFDFSRWLITISYLGIIIAGIFWIPQVNLLFLILSHLILLGLLWWQSFQVNLEEKTAIANFYQFIWKLFFAEYLLFPIALILGFSTIKLPN